jgi:hypothetical protein
MNMVHDQLISTLEQVDQANGPVLAVELITLGHFDHRQLPPGEIEFVACLGERLLSNEQLLAGRRPLFRGDARR